jgi:hypothetical protein
MEAIMKAWDKKRYSEEKEKMRKLFFNDPEFKEFISRMRKLRAN